MYIVHVFCHAKAEHVAEFKAACVANARSSVQEPGVARFDVVQQADDPTRFVLIEVYRTPDDPARHKETAHYAAWAETVKDWFAEPRSRIVYANVFPGDEGWG